MPVIGEISEKGSVIEWSIKDFLSLQGYYYQSPRFSFGNASWNLRIFSNHLVSISVSLHRVSYGPPITMSFTLGMKTTDGKLDPERHLTHTFDERCKYEGVPQWLGRSELLERKSDLLPSGTLTVVCRIEHPESAELPSLSNTVTTKCFYCNKNMGNQEDIQSHLRKCQDLPINCPKCRDDVALKNWFDHKCQMTEERALRNAGTTKCSYCNKTMDDQEDIQSHLRECEDFPIKCRKCYEGVALKNWYEHKCQMTDEKGTQCTSGPSKDLHESKVLHDYKELLMQQKECDVIITVKGQEFAAHRSILTARSSVFESTFRSDMKEKETGVVDIDDCDPSLFSDFLCFLYCGETEFLSEENVFSLFTTADKYNVQDLRDICLKFMQENISTDTFCDTIILALQYCESKLITVAANFFIKNARNIVKTVQWQRFLLTNPTQSNELIIKMLDAEQRPKNNNINSYIDFYSFMFIFALFLFFFYTHYVC